MLVITNVETIEYDAPDGVDRVRLDIHPPPRGYPQTPLDGLTAKQHDVYSEIAHSRVFVRPDGVRIKIAATIEAQDKLGLMYQAWDKMEEELGYTRRHLQSAISDSIDRDLTIRKLKAASFWTRLKWLFSGVSI